MLSTSHEIEAFIQEFEACALPKVRWTHHAHLVVALWYLTHYSYDDAIDIVRRRIRAYNEATGTPNIENGGYHETLTRWFLDGVSTHLLEHHTDALPTSLASLLQSPLGTKDWPLRFYSRERLFSKAARQQWLEPDLVATHLLS